MSIDKRVRHVGPGGARAIHWMGGTAEFLATSAHTEGSYALYVERVPAGGGQPAHVHRLEEQLYFVLAGDFLFDAAGHEFRAAPGAFVGLPKGVPHRFRHVDGSPPGRVLSAVVPGGNEDLLLTLGNPAEEPEDATMPPDIPRFTAVAESFGVTLFDPSARDLARLRLPLGLGRSPTLREPGQGEAYGFPADGAVLTFKAVGAQTSGSYTLVELELPAGSAIPARQDDYEGALFVVSGRANVEIDSQIFHADAGDLVSLPRRQWYAATNTDEAPARLLWLSTPAGVEHALKLALRPVFNPNRGRPSPGHHLGGAGRDGDGYGVGNLP